MKETASFNSIFFLYEKLRQMDCSVDVSLNVYRMAYTINRTISLESRQPIQIILLTKIINIS